MKKIFILIVAAVAAITLTAAVSASDSVPSQGTVSFESASMPALNFTMPFQRASEIYGLAPGNIRDLCESGYKAVKSKSLSSSRFTYQGVGVRVNRNGSTLDVELSYGGYKIIASNVTMEELDRLFNAE